MASPRNGVGRAIYGTGVGVLTNPLADRLEYHYGGRDTEPEPGVLAQRVRDELARRKARGEARPISGDPS